jgi:glycolate oxidase FAD binding subunit
MVGAKGVEIEELTGEGGFSLIRVLQDFPVAGETVLRWKASVLPTQIAEFVRAVEEEANGRGLAIDLAARAGNGIVYGCMPSEEGVGLGLVLSWVDWLRVVAKKLRGYVVVEDIAPPLKEKVDVWGHVGGAFPLMKRMKETLDPNGILNPGRFVGGI